MKERVPEKRTITAEVLVRKVTHSLGALILVVTAVFGLPMAQLAIVSLTALYLVSEFLRLSGRSLPLLTPLTRYASSGAEQRGVVATPIWFALGALITLTVFPFEYALIGVLTLTIGDPVASLVGLSTRSRHPVPFNESKSIEGTLAGLCASTIACALFADPLYSVVGCTVGMLAEATPLRLNDNFTVPIVSALACYALEMILV